MFKLKFVTVTGADNSVNPQDLLSIAKDFPFVEFGILLNYDIFKEPTVGKPKFPSLNWLKELLKIKEELNLSAHLCGGFCKDIVDKRIERSLRRGLYEDHTFNLFQRTQLNFSPYEIDPGYLIPILQKFPDKQFIFQIGEKNKDELIEKALKENLNFACLFDQSGGKGISPKTWPNLKENVFCGFAGGLGPDNLKEELDKIHQIVGDQEIWIDMEQKVRTDDSFDLTKVRKCLEICADLT